MTGALTLSRTVHFQIARSFRKPDFAGAILLAMKAKLLPILCAIAISIVVVWVISAWQPHFVAGSVGDFACELILIPGKLIASMFRDRGTASPEFIWRSRTATGVLLVALFYFFLRRNAATS